MIPKIKNRIKQKNLIRKVFSEILKNKGLAKKFYINKFRKDMKNKISFKNKF